MPNHALHEHRILKSLETGLPLTQRSLSKELGIALGLTNLLMRRLAKKGWIRIRHVKRNRILYLITPSGIAAKSTLTREYIRQSVRFYRETRDRIRERLAVLCAELKSTGEPTAIVFYGVGEVAEIAYVCLQETPLELVAVVDAGYTRPFFSVGVHPPADLQGNTLAGRRFARLVVMPVDDEATVRITLESCGVAPESVFWL